jgi:hypothetical protein
VAIEVSGSVQQGRCLGIAAADCGGSGTYLAGAASFASSHLRLDLLHRDNRSFELHPGRVDRAVAVRNPVWMLEAQDYDGGGCVEVYPSQAAPPNADWRLHCVGMCNRADYPANQEYRFPRGGSVRRDSGGFGLSARLGRERMLTRLSIPFDDRHGCPWVSGSRARGSHRDPTSSDSDHPPCSRRTPRGVRRRLSRLHVDRAGARLQRRRPAGNPRVCRQRALTD